MKWLIVALIVALFTGIWLWRQRQKRKEAEPEGIVLLLKQPKPLNAQFLADVLGKATDRVGQVRAVDLHRNPDQKDTNQPIGDMVMGRSPHFIVFLGGAMFAIHNAAKPYMQDPIAASESFHELRLRKAIRDHQAWLSMDIVRSEAANPEAYRVVGRVLASLIDADCVALYHPPLGRAVPCNVDETVAALKTDDPISAVFGKTSVAPVISLEEDDPRLKAAAAEARQRFPEFETAFQNNDGTDFSVKAPITSDGKTEHIWVAVDRILGGTIQGRLANEPIELGDLKLGSRVEIEEDGIEDWVFRRGDEVVGLFTGRVLQGN